MPIQSLIVAGVIVLAIGCGEGGSNEGAASSRTAVSQNALSKGEYLETAQKICERERADVLKNLGSYQRQYGALDPTDVGPKAVREILLPEFNDEIDALWELGAPSGDRADVEAFLVAKQRAVDAVNRRSLSSNADLYAAFKRADEGARSVGLDRCVYQ